MADPRERPLPMKAWEVRAVLAGMKAQVRRGVKLPHENWLGVWEPQTIGGPNGGRTSAGNTIPRQGALWHTRTGECIACPYGQPGDLLWVRETWRHTASSLEEARAITEDIASGTAVDWRATYIDRCMKELGFTREEAEMADAFEVWRPSTQMPRWASRITLQITDVRVERLQDISEEDAQAEGTYTDPACPAYDGFRTLWNSTNGPGSWEANPWVWAITFKRLEANHG